MSISEKKLQSLKTSIDDLTETNKELIRTADVLIAEANKIIHASRTSSHVSASGSSKE